MSLSKTSVVKHDVQASPSCSHVLILPISIPFKRYASASGTKEATRFIVRAIADDLFRTTKYCNVTIITEQYLPWQSLDNKIQGAHAWLIFYAQMIKHNFLPLFCGHRIVVVVVVPSIYVTQKYSLEIIYMNMTTLGCLTSLFLIFGRVQICKFT